jgi:glycerol-3-phosphate acyltransferase PlsY
VLLVAIGCVVAGYLIGTFPTALLVGRWVGVDPTRSGSGNPGATNMARTAGRRAGVLTLAGDLAKGAGAAGLGWAVGGHGLGVACGVAAVVGHVLPVQRGFRGGKGVATGAGMALVLFPAALALAAVAFAGVALATRAVGLGSIAGAVALPVAAAVTGATAAEVAALAVCAVLIVARHHDNITRHRGEGDRGLRPGHAG